MNIEQYRQRRAQDLEPTTRPVCYQCFQPQLGCYCSLIRAFDPRMRFVILFHPIERKRSIASGRMSHLILENSELIQGEDFSQNGRVNHLITSAPSVILYPGLSSMNLTELSAGERKTNYGLSDELNVFVIDGTWATARKMIRSRNLQTLPRISFSYEGKSRWGRVRKQPAEGFLSTIEAIHHTIELLGPARNFDLATRAHDNLLQVFESMVLRQTDFAEHNPRHLINKAKRSGRA